ncbi:hypothetical protein niasHT_011887 [Heterodera trifolii]|uniref:Uncharacterized protein n=1 Tax=Heterodera trifolii TaxID=157864 RepID=A0ABD2KV74_9BILA
MIGMMNNAGMDGPAEFFAGRRDLCELLVPASSLAAVDGQAQPHALPPKVFEPTQQKKLSYTGSGRRLVDGKPEVNETPEEMWRKAMLRATCTRAVKEMLGEKRRKSSKLRQLISSQSGSIRNFFGTAKNLRHRTTGANQPQQQQVEAGGKVISSRTEGPGKPDRMII